MPASPTRPLVEPSAGHAISPIAGDRPKLGEERDAARAVFTHPFGHVGPSGEKQPRDLGVRCLRDLVERLHRRAALRVVTVARAVQRRPDRTAAVVELECGAPHEQLTRDLHTVAPTRVAERDLLTVRIAVDPGAGVEQAAQRVQGSPCWMQRGSPSRRASRQRCRRVRRAPHPRDRRRWRGLRR